MATKYDKILIGLTEEHKRILRDLARREEDVPNRSEMMRRLIDRAGDALEEVKWAEDLASRIAAE
jgi:hypothetical protein